jgi:hypothetical protein
MRTYPVPDEFPHVLLGYLSRFGNGLRADGRATMANFTEWRLYADFCPVFPLNAIFFNNIG